MLIKSFKATLLENVVISQRAATEGGHGSLDYLSGATFLGAVANRLYTQLQENNNADAYTVFHSGKVRFGNALPMSEDQQLTYPMPLCWYKDKHEAFRGGMELCNYQHGELSGKKKVPEQMRSGYISLNYFNETNRFTKVVQQLRMKTAIDPQTGIARDSQLFAYNSLPEGQQFVFSLEADDDVPELFNEVVTNLLGEIKLGRSRSAEYGAVQIEALLEDDERCIHETDNREVTFWLLADAALHDEYGQALLYPTAESVGLPRYFKLDINKTFIRQRRYAPFNRYRCRRELEREVLTMGSVLYFCCDEDKPAVTTQELKTIQEQGIGIYKSVGLGRVWINPPLLADEKPNAHWNKIKKSDWKKMNPDTSMELNERYEKIKDNLVFRFLNKRQEKLGNEDIIASTTINWKKQLEKLYISASSLSYTPIGVCPGPTATQWGQVLEIAKIATADNLERELFDGDHAICKIGDLQWSKPIYIMGMSEINNFRDWLKDKIEKENQRKLLPQIVTRFARLAIDVAREETKTIRP